MSKEDKLIGSRREFLNEDLDVSMTSMVGYRIELYSYNDDCVKKGLYDSNNITFNISDCSRSISLDFSTTTKEYMKNSIDKIDTIIDVLKDFRADLKKARLEVRKGVELKKLREKFDEQNKFEKIKNEDEKFNKFVVKEMKELEKLIK